MNIVIFLWPYKQKMPSTRPFAFSIVLPSLIYYFLQEIRTEVPKYFWIRCKSPVQTSNAQRSTCDVRESAGGGARTHTALRPLDFESSASANSATPAIAVLNLQVRTRSSTSRQPVATSLCEAQSD